MFLVGATIVDNTITIMEIIIVCGLLWFYRCVPCWKRYTGNRCRRITLAIAGIVWIFLTYNCRNKRRSTLLLCLAITDTHRCICSHRHTFSDSLLEYPCDYRLVGIVALFTLDDRCEYKLLVGISSLCTIALTEPVLESS